VLLPSAVAPFVPFAFGVSPINFARNSWGAGLVAASSLLGIPLVWWQFRQLVAKPIARWERRLAYAFSADATVLVLGWIVLVVAKESVEGVLFLLLPAACAAGLWGFVRKAPVEDIPSVAFALAYEPASAAASEDSRYRG
jgi:hypothetical protein